ncbi:hypothetical protein BH11PLA1_BH11PLA1_04200 [soil metagenome]
MAASATKGDMGRFFVQRGLLLTAAIAALLLGGARAGAQVAPSSKAVPTAVDSKTAPTKVENKTEAKPVRKPAKPPANAKAREPEAPVVELPEPDATITTTFDVESTVVDAGHTHMLPIRLAAPAKSLVRPASVSSDPSVLKVVRCAEVLEGFDLGFVRVLALRPGEVDLRIGTGVQHVRVVMPRSPVWSDLGSPAVIAPLDGACAWDEVSVGVRWLENPSAPLGAVSLRVEVPGLPPRVIASASITEVTLGPSRLARFVIDARALLSEAEVETALVTLTPVAQPASEPAMASAEAPGAGRAIRVRLIRPRAEAVIADDAAELKDTERPKRFERGKVSIATDPRSHNGAGGKVAMHNSADPPTCMPLHVTETGMYQMIITAAGDFGLGAYPTVGFTIDNANQPVTSGQLLASGYHRLAVGVPVKIEAGERVIAARFENDISAGNLGDRNLRLERIELLNISEALLPAARKPGAPVSTEAKVGAAPEGMAPGDSMTGGGMMQPQAQGGEGMMAKGEASTKAPPDTMMSAGADGAPKTDVIDPAAPGALQRDDHFGIAYRGARVEWMTLFDGELVTAPVELEGLTTWEAADRTPAPRTVLLINGFEAASQYAVAPRFWIDQTWLRPGVNTLQLAATTHDGVRSESLVQTLRRDVKAAALVGGAADLAAARSFARFTVHDAAWSASLRDRSRLKGDAREFRTVGLPAGVPYVLTLPDAATGPRRVWLEARGAASKGIPKVTLMLRSGAGAGAAEMPIGTVQLRSQIATVLGGEIDLPAGAKQIVLSFDHKGYEEGTGEPGMFFESVLIENAPAPGNPEGGGSAVTVLYPGSSSTPHEVSTVDAVVARLEGGAAPATVEALIDNVPTGLPIDVQRRVGALYVPYALRGVSAGTHSVALRVTDVLGGTVSSAPVAILVRAAPISGAPAGDVGENLPLTRYQRAVQVATRFGYGPDERVMAELLTVGADAWLERQFGGGGTGASRAIAASVMKNLIQRNDNDLVQRYISQQNRTDTPALARLNVWTQNHFTTWLRKVEGDRKWEEYQRLARLGGAPLGDLLLASATSGAMMLYLDQANSYKGRLNENYAREIMELHTLGVHAGYTQSDVTSLAHIITGWIATREGESQLRNDGDVRTWAFRFDPRLNDDAPQTVFGLRFSAAQPIERFDRALMALEMLARHPKTAEFIAEQLCEHYLDAPAESTDIQRVARTLQREGGDLSAAVREIAKIAGKRPALLARLSHPLDFAVRIQRATGQSNPGAVSGFLKRCKAGVFDCPTPDGYDAEDPPWADSNAMIQRFKFARESAPALVTMLPATIRGGGKSLTHDQEQLALDFIAIRVTGSVLGTRSNEAVWTVLDDSKGSVTERLREMAAMVAAMPEAQVR